MIIRPEHNINKTVNKAGMRKGFSLAEVMAALTIGAMILVAVLGIYNSAEKSASKIMLKLDSSRLSSEVLQRIAEDLDRIISSNPDTKVKIENKLKNGFPAAKITITKTIKDSRNKEVNFEEIVWQSIYNYENPDVGLVLYRSYSGMALEDKLLDKSKDDLELERAVPICSGVTFFNITALKGDAPADKWDGPPPPGIEVTMSFAEPFKRVNGTLDVLDEEKIKRTIAIDRTRKINFKIEPSVSSEKTKTPEQTDIPNEGKLSLGRTRKIEDDE
jgi:prepilin-type N-terminal cleavage/methylation domain-containing protein